MSSSEIARPVALRHSSDGSMGLMVRPSSPSGSSSASPSPPPQYSRSSYNISSSPPPSPPPESHRSTTSSSWSPRRGDSLAGRPKLRKLMSTDNGCRILVLDLETGAKFWAVRRLPEFSDSKTTPPRSAAVRSLQFTTPPNIHYIPPTPLKPTLVTARSLDGLSRERSRLEVLSLVEKRSASKF